MTVLTPPATRCSAVARPASTRCPVHSLDHRWESLPVYISVPGTYSALTCCPALGRWPPNRPYVVVRIAQNPAPLYRLQRPDVSVVARTALAVQLTHVNAVVFRQPCARTVHVPFRTRRSSYDDDCTRDSFRAGQRGDPGRRARRRPHRRRRSLRHRRGPPPARPVSRSDLRHPRRPRQPRRYLVDPPVSGRAL